jgi:Lipid A 3-O-deacylase (PagL).
MTDRASALIRPTLLAVAWLCLVLTPVCGQDSSKRVWGAEGHIGFILVHSPEVEEASKDANPVTANLSINWQNLRKETWDLCQCYPRSGFALAYQAFDNPGDLGQGITGSGYLEPVFRLSEGWAFSFQGEVGLSYLNKPYDAETNPQNQSYSVRVNGFLSLRTTLNYRLSPHWQLQVAANYNHISNGSIEQPNKGINYPTATIGVDYQPGQWVLPDYQKADRQVSPTARHQGEVNIRLGTKERQAGDENARYWNYGLEGFYNHQLTPIHQLRVGGAWVLNNAVRATIKEDPEVKLAFKEYQRLNALAGHAFSLGQFRFSTLAGLYVYRPYEDEPPWYQQYSLTYQLQQPWHAGVALKSHANKADFLDIRLSYRF